MTRAAVIGSLGLWSGMTLLLSLTRWSRRTTLQERLRPYQPGVPAAPTRAGLFSVASFRDLVAPLSREIGERVARLFGVDEDLALRLERIHSPLDVTTFRTRQVGWATAALGVGLIAAVGLRLPTALATLFVLGGPLLTFLLLEQQVASASAAWQRRLFLELPVVAEQLAMLLASGYSLGGALNRLAQRSGGACGADLQRVCARTRQGLTEAAALREWAAVAGVDAVERLVSVLALNREATDLGHLVAEEARAIRRDAHRELLERIERRNQQVWIPVTVAALVPGVAFLAVPFVEALRLFGA